MLIFKFLDTKVSAQARSLLFDSFATW